MIWKWVSFIVWFSLKWSNYIIRIHVLADPKLGEKQQSATPRSWPSAKNFIIFPLWASQTLKSPKLVPVTICMLSGVKQQVITLLSSFSVYLTSFFDDTSHIQKVSSAEPVTRKRELGEKRQTRTPLLCPCRTAVTEPVFISHKWTLPSVEAVASRVPNGEKSQEFTPYEWPSKGETESSVPSSTFQSRTVLSPELEANTLLFGEKLQDVTSLPCFENVFTRTDILKSLNYITVNCSAKWCTSYSSSSFEFSNNYVISFSSFQPTSFNIYKWLVDNGHVGKSF